MPLAPSTFLRTAVLASLAAVALALPVQLTVGENALDRAIAIEQASVAHDGGPELFSRAEQRGGLVVGQLVLAGGFAFMLAGASTLLSRRLRSTRVSVVWVLLVAAAGWSITVVPAAVFPPLMPGMTSELSIGVRQVLYLAAILCGALGFVAAGTAVKHVRNQGRGRSAIAASVVLLVALGVTLAVFPGQTISSDVPTGALAQFRAASLIGQSLFWIGMASAGFVLLRRLEDTGGAAALRSR